MDCKHHLLVWEVKGDFEYDDDIFVCVTCSTSFKFRKVYQDPI